MKRTFVSSLLVVLLLNILIKPLWILGIDRGVQNTVGTEAYGLYFALFNFSLLFNIILDLGITNFNNRNIAQHQHLLAKHLVGISILRLLLTLVYFVFGIGLAYVLGYPSSAIIMLFHLMINQCLAAFILYLRSNISGLHLFKTDAFFSVLDRIIMIALCGLMLWGNVENYAITIERFILAQSIAYGITLCSVLIAVLVKSGRIHFYVSKAFFVMILKKSSPYALLILLMSAYFRSDSIMIERLLPNGEYQAGVYAQSYRLLDAAGMFGYLIAGILLPIFSRQLSKKEDVGEMFRLGIILLATPLIILVTAVILYRNYILDILYHQNSPQAPLVLLILMLALIPFSLNYISGTLLTASGNLKKLNKMTFVVMFLNIGLNLLGIPYFGILGAALVALLTQSLMCFLLFRTAIIEFNISGLQQITKRLLLFVIVSVLIFGLIDISNLSEPLAMLFGAIICMLFIIPLKLVSIQDIAHLLSQKRE